MLILIYMIFEFLKIEKAEASISWSCCLIGIGGSKECHYIYLTESKAKTDRRLYDTPQYTFSLSCLVLIDSDAVLVNEEESTYSQRDFAPSASTNINLEIERHADKNSLCAIRWQMKCISVSEHSFASCRRNVRSRSRKNIFNIIIVP